MSSPSRRWTTTLSMSFSVTSSSLAWALGRMYPVGGGVGPHQPARRPAQPRHPVRRGHAGQRERLAVLAGLVLGALADVGPAAQPRQGADEQVGVQLPRRRRQRLVADPAGVAEDDQARL